MRTKQLNNIYVSLQELITICTDYDGHGLNDFQDSEYEGLSSISHVLDYLVQKKKLTSKRSKKIIKYIQDSYSSTINLCSKTRS
jgi:hypothetical protein